MEPLTLQTIAEFANGTLCRGGGDVVVSEISTDSRTLRRGDLFLALRGDRFDGHTFVKELARRGAAAAVVDRTFVADALPADFALIEVGDTLTAYQDIAARYRRQLGVDVIGITGSNGKTSTKDFTAAVLGRRFRVLKTEGNLNNHIGVPRTLLRAGATDQVAVLEMGMNHPGEIATLARIAMPRVAIITNIGSAHLEFMGTRQAIAREKGSLAEAVDETGHVILNADDDFSAVIAKRTRARVITAGLRGGMLQAKAIQEGLDGSRFIAVAASGEKSEVFLPVPGLHMVSNALLAIAAGQVFGLTLAECAAGLADTLLTKGRMERKTVRGITFLDDSYNANPESMAAAIYTLARMQSAGRRFAVLGRMAELGATAEASHARVGQVTAETGVDVLIGVGSEAAGIVAAARTTGLTDSYSVDTAGEAAALLGKLAKAGDLVLIKGSRSAAMETVLKEFQSSGL